MWGAELARVPWSYAEFLFQAKDWKTRVEKFEDRVEKIEEVVGIKHVQHLYYEELQKDLLGTLTKNPPWSGSEGTSNKSSWKYESVDEAWVRVCKGHA